MAEPKTKVKAGFKSPAAAPAASRVNAAERTIDDVKVTHIQVRSLANGFRRAGRAWSTDTVIVPIDEFTVEQVEQLVAEPMLVVVPVGEMTGAEAK